MVSNATAFRVNSGKVLNVTRKQIIDSMAVYDKLKRTSETDAGRLYAVNYHGRLYPPKAVLALALGAKVSDFSGGESRTSANRVFRDLGFEIIYIAAERIPKLAHDPDKINAPIPSVSALLGALFTSRWTDLHDRRANIRDVQYPGVYLIAYSSSKLEGKQVRESDVFYVGMSNSSLIGRLNQFVAGLENGGHHSGAKRFFNEYALRSPYTKLRRRRRFFVAAIGVPCVVNKQRRIPDDLRKMGEVARLEYYALARVREATRSEPELNKK